MAKKEGGGAFAIAQQIGKSLFLPIAVLPPAGILLGIGSSFTNPTTIATYGLTNILHPGTLLYSFMMMLNGAGNAIFGGYFLSGHAHNNERPPADHRTDRGRCCPAGRQGRRDR